jgi:hypothetical protein
MPQPDAFAVVSSVFVNGNRFGFVTHVQVSKQMESVESSLKDLGNSTGTDCSPWLYDNDVFCFRCWILLGSCVLFIS